MDGTNRIDELEQKFIENPRRYFAPLANEYRKAGNPHQAIAICRAHLAQLPGHMSGQIVYGQALFEGGEYDQAQTVFENALAMDRENLVALRHLGDLALRKGETAAARQWYAKFLEIDPKDTAVIALVDELDAAAEAQSSTTDTELSSTTTSEAVQPMSEPQAEPEHSHNDEEDNLLAEELGYPVPPAHAFVTETMAELYLAQGFRDRALSVYRQLVEVRPEDERLRKRLAELEEPGASTETAPSTETAAGSDYEPVEARRDETPSVESPEAPREDEHSPSIEAPTPSPEVQPPSEESEEGQTPAIDSPPSEVPEAEPGSVESVGSDEQRPEAEALAAAEDSPPKESRVRTGEFASEESPSIEADAPAALETDVPASFETEMPAAPEADVPASFETETPAAFEANVPPSLETETPPALEAPAPRVLTVREFFASLGKCKPAARTNGSSSNGASETETNWNSSADSASASDAKAAAALAGAFGGAPVSPSFAEASASPVPGKESEEDVARFRAWLDGLTT